MLPGSGGVVVVISVVPRTGGKGVMVSPGKGQRRPAAQMRPERQQPPISGGHSVKEAKPLQGRSVWRVTGGGTTTGGTLVVGGGGGGGGVVVVGGGGGGGGGRVDGDTVNVGFTASPLTQPTSKQENPATQHAPPRS